MLRIDPRNKLSTFNEHDILLLKSALYDKLNELDYADTLFPLKFLYRILSNIGIDSRTWDLQKDFSQLSIELCKGIKPKEIDPQCVYFSDEFFSRNTLILDNNSINELGNIIVSYYSRKAEPNFDEDAESFTRRSTNCTFESWYLQVNSSDFRIEEIDDHLKCISHLILTIPKDINFRLYLLILINASWLFRNVLKITIDFSIPTLSREMSNNMNDGFDSYQKVMREQTQFELTIIIPFLILQAFNPNPNFLKIKLPNSLNSELELLLKSQRILLNDFHILNIFDLTAYLTSLHLEFNSLDSPTFLRTLSIIHKNNHLRMIKMKLFSENHFCLSKINYRRDDITENKDHLVDDQEYKVNLLLPEFIHNLESLICVLKSKATTLSKLNLELNLPSIFCIDDKCINIIHKYVLNLLLTYSEENCLRNFIIRSTNYNLDGRKYNYLNKFIEDNINLQNKTNIKCIAYNFKMNSILIEKLIPYGIESLTLGEVDLSIMDKITELLPNLSKLKFLSFKASDFLIDFRKNESLETLYKFFKKEKLQYINEIRFTLNSLFITNDIIMNILTILKENKADRTESYRLFLNNINSNSDYSSNVGEINRQNIFYYLIPDKTRMECLVFAKKYSPFLAKCNTVVMRTVNKFMMKKKEKRINVES